MENLYIKALRKPDRMEKISGIGSSQDINSVGRAGKGILEKVLLCMSKRALCQAD